MRSIASNRCAYVANITKEHFNPALDHRCCLFRTNSGFYVYCLVNTTPVTIHMIIFMLQMEKTEHCVIILNIIR